MKKLKFIQACPNDSYYLWQVATWLDSLKRIGKSQDAISCIFIPKDRNHDPKWDKLVKDFPESEFFFYKDTDNISAFLGLYIPILRPYILSKYFQLHPELKNDAILYCDADIIFTEKFNVSHLVDDDICYLSNTNSYINSDYFDSKIRDVLPKRLEEYKKRDILEESCKFVGISKDTVVKNKEHSGGAQYLLKNIDSAFWIKIIDDCLTIRRHLLNTNKYFFESEIKGFQSWTADMWAVLWNLWYRGLETKIVPEMDFAWSSDHISRLDKVGILHNAGVTGDIMSGTPVFYKGRYINGSNPFEDPYLHRVLNDDRAKNLCNHHYLTKALETYNKYNKQ